MENATRLLQDSPGEDSADARLRKLRYRAWHRGMREMDLILGPFADTQLVGLSETDLQSFEALMDVPDGDLQDWLLHGRIADEPFETPLLQLVRAYNETRLQA